MTRTTIRSRRQRRAQPTQNIYLPHSSWTRVEPVPAANATIAPDDFWLRLGL
ncbi:hypothetical protein MOK15_02170 [Sphingobium sp. BYY-5]|uniref:hypothetical protein n=1 Tax=Sphingobium sp. BYY-5 TaxID=2926400 RepID=UPI001FA74E23|nr:hypothetical protein [Sphingobium sp. BYY-5]MCI4588915.1 hypothetical protein [Sphingobium sp. BYY-5]